MNSPEKSRVPVADPTADPTAEVPALSPDSGEVAELGGDGPDAPTLVDLKLRRAEDPADTDEDDGAA